MQESVRRIIEAEEARMGKDHTVIYLFHKLEREGSSTEAGWLRGRNARSCFFISTPNESRCNRCGPWSGEVPL